MKYLISTLVLAVPLCAQQASAPAPQPPPGFAELDPETVIASHNGRKLTYGEVRGILGILPPQTQQNAMRDRKSFVVQYFLMQHLAELAEKQKLDQQSPTKEMLAFQRASILSSAELNEAMGRMPVTPEEQQKFYDSNRDKYAQVKVKVIYVSFVANPPAQTAPDAKKPLTEAEAKAKIEKIRADAGKGADFVKLVKENSEDQTSREKDGDFGTIRRSDNLPDNIRATIFALKSGEISQPVRQPNGFYLFRAEEVNPQPYGEVRNEIHTQIQQTKFKQWMDELNRRINTDVKLENNAFFTAAPASALK